MHGQDHQQILQGVVLIWLYPSQTVSPAFGLLSELSEPAPPEMSISGKSFSGVTSLLMLLLEKRQVWVKVNKLSLAGSFPHQSSPLCFPQPLAMKFPYRSAEIRGATRHQPWPTVRHRPLESNLLSPDQDPNLYCIPSGKSAIFWCHQTGWKPHVSLEGCPDDEFTWLKQACPNSSLKFSGFSIQI